MGHYMGNLQNPPNDISYEYILSFPDGISEKDDYTVQQSIYLHDEVFVKASRQYHNYRLD
jgi:hypothetical protein